MGSIDDDLERELRSLGIHEDLGTEDSDATPTNSPTPASFKPFHSSRNENHSSSKTSGFWEDSNMGRYSQMSNCSSGSDSSLSWGEDNFEGEATRQVTLLFEQLDDLLFSDFERFPSYPVVPLCRKNKAINNEGENVTKSGNNVSSHHSPNNNRSHKEAKNVKDLPFRKGQRALPWNSHNVPSETFSGSDSGDEVVWETLSRPKKEAKGKLTSKKQRNDLLVQRRQQKTLRKKLSTISELGPRSKKSLSADSLSVALLKVKPKIRHYSESDGEDSGAFDALDNVEAQDIIFASTEVSDEIPSESSQIKEGDESSHAGDGASGESNLRGGIYAMGFTAPIGSQVTSPLLLPTPATPPGVPLQPTPVMVEESSHWSSRFPYLRVTGHGINPLKLKYMEEFAFANKSVINGSSESVETDTLVLGEQDTSSSEEEEEEENYLARDGIYDSNAGHLCLTGSYLPHFSQPLHKPSHEMQPSKSDFLENPSNEPSAKPSDEGPTISTESRKSSRDGRRVWSGSQDPAVLKEQVLLMLFDSVWPQVINIVGGLVHRYSCHLLARFAMLSNSTSGRSSRIETSSTVSEMDVWRRLDSASIFSRRASLQNSFGNSSRETSASSRALPRSADPRNNILRQGRNTSDCRVADIQEENFSSQNFGSSYGHQLKRSKSSAGRSRLSTAKALMQVLIVC
ncbi:hypothetical protein FHG87_010248 [Trinorchestia longiramus]|nr:hypothetical protein FHG87_010248 [Trinorchestia longiramus]